MREISVLIGNCGAIEAGKIDGTKNLITGLSSKEVSDYICKNIHAAGASEHPWAGEELS